jgi:hypothetical protein
MRRPQRASSSEQDNDQEVFTSFNASLDEPVADEDLIDESIASECSLIIFCPHAVT